MTTERAPRMAMIANVSKIASAHLGKTQVPAEDIASVLEEIHATLSGLADPAGRSTSRVPAVPIAQSIGEDHLICLEDGKPVRVLSRYISQKFGLTPAEYRERWGLPADYPMVPASYSQKRSELSILANAHTRVKKKIVRAGRGCSGGEKIGDEDLEAFADIDLWE
ncbi:MAG: MucR family transcriptional regulator [Pseudomonadota bacterium]